MRKEKQFREEFLFEANASDTGIFLEREKSQNATNFTYEIPRHRVVLF